MIGIKGMQFILRLYGEKVWRGGRLPELELTVFPSFAQLLSFCFPARLEILHLLKLERKLKVNTSSQSCLSWSLFQPLSSHRARMNMS